MLLCRLLLTTAESIIYWNQKCGNVRDSPITGPWPHRPGVRHKISGIPDKRSIFSSFVPLSALTFFKFPEFYTGFLDLWNMPTDKGHESNANEKKLLVYSTHLYVCPRLYVSYKMYKYWPLRTFSFFVIFLCLVCFSVW